MSEYEEDGRDAVVRLRQTTSPRPIPLALVVKRGWKRFFIFLTRVLIVGHVVPLLMGPIPDYQLNFAAVRYQSEKS